MGGIDAMLYSGSSSMDSGRTTTTTLRPSPQRCPAILTTLLIVFRVIRRPCKMERDIGLFTDNPRVVPWRNVEHIPCT